MRKMNRNIFSCLFLCAFIILSIIVFCPTTQQPQSNYISHQLKEITTQEGNCVKLDYVNEVGEITIAADQGYATKTITTTERGITEAFFDDKGEPIARLDGFYRVFREYDDMNNNIRITYQDKDGRSMTRSEGYATEERIFNEKRQIIKVTYLGVDGEPVSTQSSGYGKINEYDQNGEICKTTFLDMNDKPVMTGLGYSIKKQSVRESDVDEKKKIVTEKYYDEMGNPIALSLGQYGIYKEYDENGKIINLTYMNKNNKPMITTKGYTTIKRTYQINGEIASEMYFDINGDPFSLSEGHYGISRENEQTIYLDKDGNRVFNVKNLLYNQSWMVVAFALILAFICPYSRKKERIVFLLLYILLIGYLTLMFRENGNSRMQFVLFWNYSKIISNNRTRVDILRNIWLFVPLGIILYSIYPKRIIILIPFLLSTGIEIIQYITGTGLCEMDDVIHNGIGGIVGYEMEKTICDMFSYKKKQVIERNK